MLGPVCKFVKDAANLLDRFELIPLRALCLENLSAVRDLYGAPVFILQHIFAMDPTLQTDELPDFVHEGSESESSDSRSTLVCFESRASQPRIKNLDRTRILSLYLHRTCIGEPALKLNKDVEDLMKLNWLGTLVLFDIKHFLIGEAGAAEKSVIEIMKGSRAHPPNENIKSTLSCMAAYRIAKINLTYSKLDGKSDNEKKPTLNIITDLKSTNHHAGLMTLHALLLADKIPMTLSAANTTPANQSSAPGQPNAGKKTLFFKRNDQLDIKATTEEMNKLLEKSANLHCPIAAYTRARLYLANDCTLPSELWEPLLRAANIGYSPAQVLAAQIYQSSKKDPSTFRPLYEAAAAQEEPEACVQLALMHLGWEPGATLPIQQSAAAIVSSGARAPGQNEEHQSASASQGESLEPDAGEVLRRCQSAIKLLQIAEKKKYAPATTILSLCHHYGIGVEQDPAKTKDLLGAASAKAEPAAIANYLVVNGLQATIRSNREAQARWTSRIDNAMSSLDSPSAQICSVQNIQTKLKDYNAQLQQISGVKRA